MPSLIVKKMKVLQMSDSKLFYTLSHVSELMFFYNFILISSDTPCKDGNVEFTTVPLKPDQQCGRYCRFSRFNVFHSVNYKMFSCKR